MTRSLKIAILRADDCDDSTLKPALLAIDGVHVVGEIKPAGDLVASVRQYRPDVLLLTLGQADGARLLNGVSELMRHSRELSVVLAGPRRDPDLLLTAMRTGVREFIELPTRPEDLIEVLQKIMEVQPNRQTGKLILVHGSGGGCGASVLACNLAVEISRSGRGRVALVDMDLHRGQLAAMLDVFPTYNILDVCPLEGDDFDAGRLESALLKHDSGVRLLARPKELIDDDLRLLRSAAPEILHGLQDTFDYILVDFDLQQDVTGGRLSRMADEVLLVSQPVISSIRNASEIIQTFDAQGLDLDRLRLVLSRVPRKLGSVRIDSVEKSLKRNVFWEVPEDYVGVSESVNLGVPLGEHATSSKTRCSIRDLALAVTRADSGGASADKKVGLFKRMFSHNVA